MSTTTQAWSDAEAALDRSGAHVVMATTPGLCRVASDLVTDIWDPGGSPVVDANLLQALSHSDNYVSIAHDAPGRAVGVAIAFFSSPAPPDPMPVHLHSHIVGIVPGSDSRGVGYALKLHQRAWALDRGVPTMVWTYDPLIRRNARFNLVKLGARAAAHHVDHYGEMRDARNAGFGSDRILVEWRLDEPLRTGARTFADAEAWLAVTADDRPAPGAAPEAGASGTVALPADIEAIRASDPALAAQWRSAIRAVFAATVDAGTHTIAGLDDQGRYRLEATA